MLRIGHNFSWKFWRTEERLNPKRLHEPYITALYTVFQRDIRQCTPQPNESRLGSGLLASMRKSARFYRRVAIELHHVQWSNRFKCMKKNHEKPEWSSQFACAILTVFNNNSDNNNVRHLTVWLTRSSQSGLRGEEPNTHTLTQKFLHLIFTHVNVDTRTIVVSVGADYPAGSGEAQGRLEQQEHPAAPECPEGWKRPSAAPRPATPGAPRRLLLPQHRTFTLPSNCSSKPSDLSSSKTWVTSRGQHYYSGCW